MAPIMGMFVADSHFGRHKFLQVAMADSSGGRAARGSSANNVKLDFLDDLSVIPAPQFVERLRKVYSTGQAAVQFHGLSRQLTRALKRSAAPCTFVARCLEALLEMGPPNDQNIGYLVTRSLSELDESFKPAEDMDQAKRLAAKVFRDVIKGQASADCRLLVRFILALQVQVSDVAQAGDYSDEALAKSSIESFILKLVRQKAYSAVVSLLKHFVLQDCTSEDFIVAMVAEGQWELAGQWAEFLGKDSCIFLVEQCRKRGLYKPAFRLVKLYDLNQEFPDAFHVYRRGSLRKLVGKGVWDVAEAIAGDDRILQEYLIMLALGRREHKRAEALCNAFQLKDYDLSAVEITEMEAPCEYIQLESLLEHEKVLWIDKTEDLSLVLEALPNIEVVGIDGEWKANRIKGQEPNKVSILQLATGDKVFVLDLLKLSNDAPEELSHCIESIFASQRILKLGFGLHNDLDRLAQSYPQVTGFHSCVKFLDLESFPERRPKGGLSGLAKTFMGGHLDKSVRMSDWSQRPLTNDQLLYAALDAAILLPLHQHICSAHSIAGSGRSSAKTWHSTTRRTN